MKFKPLLLPILFLLLALVPAQARIGETIDQCKARYAGLKVSEKPDEYMAVVGNLRINLHFFNNVCDMLVYTPIGEEPLDPDVAAKLIDANCGVVEWEAIDPTDPTIKECAWSKDNKFMWAHTKCVKGAKHLSLLVATTVGLERVAQESKKEKLKAVEGL